MRPEISCGQLGPLSKSYLKTDFQVPYLLAAGNNTGPLSMHMLINIQCIDNAHVDCLLLEMYAFGLHSILFIGMECVHIIYFYCWKCMCGLRFLEAVAPIGGACLLKKTDPMNSSDHPVTLA